MSVPATPAMTRERNLILTLLLTLSLVSWGVLVWQAGTADGMAASLMMGLEAPLFLANWVVMMVAMMFPTAAPMILVFARVSASKRDRGEAFVPTWIFVAAYLVIWTLFGVIAYGGAMAAQAAATSIPFLAMNAARVGGLALILAGVYQLTPLKRVCVTQCRSPLAFIVSSWRSGHGGAFRMGLEHGVYCLGCCWFLFVILFPLGIMNVGAMALITLLIFTEKSLAVGPRVSAAAAVILVLYGAAIVTMPWLLPTMIPAGGMDM